MSVNFEYYFRILVSKNIIISKGFMRDVVNRVEAAWWYCVLALSCQIS